MTAAAEPVAEETAPTTWLEAPPPGLHPKASERAYRLWRAECQSELKIIAYQHEAAYRQLVTTPPEPTDAKDFGTAYHAAILEPDTFEGRFVGGIKTDRRTKEGKAEWAKFCADNEGKEVIAAKDFARLCRMRDAFWRHPDAVELMRSPGRNEVSATARDPESGLLLKCRVDRVTTYDGWSALVDFKNTKAASQKDFPRECATYGYTFQAAFYLHCFHVLAAAPRRFLIVAQDNTVAGYSPILYEVAEDELDECREDYEDALKRLVRARETGVWPGYPRGPHVLRRPRYARRGEPLRRIG